MLFRSLDSRGQLTPELTLSASGAWNDAKYVDYKSAPPPQELRYPGAAKTVDLSGKQIPGVAAVSGQIGLDYQHTLANDVTLTAYVNQTYRSSTRYILLSDYGHQKAYGLTNLGVGLESL